VTQLRWNFLLILHSDNGLCMTHAPTSCARRGILKKYQKSPSVDDRFRVCILISMYSSVVNEHNDIGTDSTLTRRRVVHNPYGYYNIYSSYDII